MIVKIEITFPDDIHMGAEYREEIYQAFRILCDNIDTNGIYCTPINREFCPKCNNQLILEPKYKIVYQCNLCDTTYDKKSLNNITKP